MERTALRIVVYPVPGPPVMTETLPVTAIKTAWRLDEEETVPSRGLCVGGPPRPRFGQRGLEDAPP